MRSFFRQLFAKRVAHKIHPPHPPPQSRPIMSSSASALIYGATVAVPSIASTRPDDEITKTKKWHVKSGGFDNPWPSWHFPSFWTIMSGMLGRRFSGQANKPDTTPPTVPVHPPTFLPSRTASTALRATWLGHACYYVEFPSGLRVLFDPVFTDRCSPFSWLGPKRYTEMPCQIKDIPTIDAVVISHNHYDHLSHPTIMEIRKLHPEAHFFVPLGNKKWFKACGIEEHCTEMDWWDEIDFTLTPSAPAEKKGSITSTDSPTPKPAADTITSRISCLPCQHMSARSIHDRCATLWASWSVSSGGKSVYFGGDTGYRSVPKESDGKDDWAEEYSSLPHCPAFADIGRLRGPFDLGLIPIGAYMPRWIMSPMHCDPRDAVEVFRDTKCKKAMGIHWGTWVLTEEDVLEPPRLLKKALALHSIPETGVFDVCDIGDSREF
ncbi:beta-lactamase superfamily domain-containing protein [Exophiala viscosa]|uniref:Beta-lactamase superfamily domain-containing protein n=1 Tax=Exophiala viscosa TaxID=2486360 RepID=A0AAN6IB24_9EURO|nr:beta-lactamase superfamily domain-containing protein [Exophiala viscosa]